MKETSRREFCRGIATLLGSSVLAGTAFAREEPYLPENLYMTSQDLVVMEEAAEKYKELLGDKDQVTILYPGSGGDLSDLELAVQLLLETKVRQATLIHTEIGELDRIYETTKDNAWHSGRHSLERNMERVVRKARGNVFSYQRRTELESPWRRKEFSNSHVTEFKIKVGHKEVRLLSCYNTFDQREEPRAEEGISPKLMERARD